MEKRILCLALIIMVLISGVSRYHIAQIEKAEGILDQFANLLISREGEQAFEMIYIKSENQALMAPWKRDYIDRLAYQRVEVSNRKRINQNLYRFDLEIEACYPNGDVLIDSAHYFVLMDGEKQKVIINQRDIPQQYSKCYTLSPPNEDEIDVSEMVWDKV